MRTAKMIWHRKGTEPDHACAACGRRLADHGNWAVHVIDGGGAVLHPEDEGKYQADAGDMGCHMLGPECRKKFGEFAFPWN